jgi:hypothetical protein
MPDQSRTTLNSCEYLVHPSLPFQFPVLSTSPFFRLAVLILPVLISNHVRATDIGAPRSAITVLTPSWWCSEDCDTHSLTEPTLVVCA